MALLLGLAGAGTGIVRCAGWYTRSEPLRRDAWSIGAPARPVMVGAGAFMSGMVTMIEPLIVAAIYVVMILAVAWVVTYMLGLIPEPPPYIPMYRVVIWVIAALGCLVVLLGVAEPAGADDRPGAGVVGA